MSRSDAPLVYVCYIDDGFERIEIDRVFWSKEKASDYCSVSENLYFKEREIE